MLLLRATLLASILALGACSSADTPPTELADDLPAPGIAPLPVASPQSPNECNAGAAQFLVGRPYDAAAREAAVAATGAETGRVIMPDDVVTMDFNPQRLNLVIDRQNRISEVRCG